MGVLRKCAYFVLGGAGYVALELLWRGRSHPSMFAAGGVCFLLLGQLGKVKRLPPALRCVIGAAVITGVELAAGMIANRSYQVWDYRQMPMNFLGQICMGYSLLWVPVSFGAMELYGWIERMGKPRA